MAWAAIRVSGIEVARASAIVFASWLAAWSPVAHAAALMTGISVNPRSGIQIEIQGYYNQLPPAGYVPVRISIRNGAKREHSWQFEFESRGNYDAPFTHRYQWEATVAAGKQATYDVLVPLSPLQSVAHSYPALSVRARGHGITYGNAHYASNTKYTGHTHTVFIGMSPGLAIPYFTPLEVHLAATSRELQSCSLDRDWMSDDWRAYLGFGALWFTDEDWSHVPASARSAILTWVAAGGRLTVVADVADRFDAERRRTLGIRAGKGRIGLGVVDVVRWLDEGTLDLRQAADAIEALKRANHADVVSSGYANTKWPLQDAVTSAAFHPIPIVVAIVFFGFLVGPVNLLWLAGRDRRYRLFITTPLLSIGASVLLVALILFQDGIGATGRRNGLLLLQPDRHAVLQIQEQVARTGVMMEQRYAMAASVYQAPITLDASDERRRSLARSGTEAFGDWFVNRSVQAQYLAQQRSSRARVEWLNPDDDAAPEVVSTVEYPLREVLFVDDVGQGWTTDVLRAGQSTRLVQAGMTASRWRLFNAGVKGPYGGAGPEAYNGHHSYVFAVADAPDEAWLPSPASVDWQDSHLVVMGPVVRAGGGSP